MKMPVFKNETVTFKDEASKPKKKERKPKTAEQKRKWAEYMRNYWREHPDKYQKNLALTNERNRRRREELNSDAKKSN